MSRVLSPHEPLKYGYVTSWLCHILAILCQRNLGLVLQVGSSFLLDPTLNTSSNYVALWFYNYPWNLSITNEEASVKIKVPYKIDGWFIPIRFPILSRGLNLFTESKNLKFDIYTHIHTHIHIHSKNCSIVTTKVHVKSKSFVMLTWVCDKRESI